MENEVEDLGAEIQKEIDTIEKEIQQTDIVIDEEEEEKEE